MASTSSSQQQNQEFNAFSGVEPAGRRRTICESSKLYDVFLNHRGPDVKQTLAIQLYNSLEELGIRVFLDSQEKELGISFPSILETAIRSAKVHIAIFSKRYGESPWCLAELVLMLQSKAKIIPVFYEVKPWELRHIEKGVYHDAFIEYEEKGRYLDKLSQWKEALNSVSFIAGEEFDSFSDYKDIVVAVQKEVKRKTCLHVAEYPVGLNSLVKDFEKRCLDELVEDFENQCGLKEDFENRCGLMAEKDQAKVVGIFGMGGSGKTTLAKELFNRKMLNYSKSSFLFDVREAYGRSDLSSLQLKLLKDLFDEHRSFTSTEEGTSYLKDCVWRSCSLSFLIVVDDIDHVQQLNALLVMDILHKSRNALVIVTTRDVGVLITAGITVRYNLKGMVREHGRELFCWHAFGQRNPKSRYNKLVNSFVDVCRGLPLSLQVLGRHVHGRSPSYWDFALTKASQTLPGDVKQRLRISFDALDGEQKQVFMDIACFFVGKFKSTAERVWEASGWNAQHTLETLKDKSLVEEIKAGEILLRMHDHLRDLGREMALELSSHRLWRPKDLKSLAFTGFKSILTKTNVRCFHSMFDKSMDSRVTFFVGQSDNFGETSISLLWLKLEGNSTEQSSIPSWIPLQNLHYLEINSGQLKTLWENNIQAPSHLKELLIFHTSLKEFPDLSGLSDSLENVFLESLEKLVISHENFVSKILISGIHYPSLESIKLEGMKNLMEVNLRRVKTIMSLNIIDCEKLKRLTGTSDLTNLELLRIIRCPDLSGISDSLENVFFESLEKLEISGESFTSRILIRGTHYPSLESITLEDMKNLMEVDLRRLKILKSLNIIDCKKLKRLTGTSDLTNLALLRIIQCPDLEELRFAHLKSVFGIFSLTKLVELEICGCGKLEFDHLCLSGMNCLERMIFDRHVKMKCFELDGCRNLKAIKFGCEELIELSIRGCPELKELPFLLGSSCLEMITIDECGRLECLRADGCQNLKSVSGNFELRQLHIIDCPELEEVPRLDRLSLRSIIIHSCEKLRIEECHASGYMSLCYCRNAEIRSCIHSLKSIPPHPTIVLIGRAVDGEESTLNQYPFSEFETYADIENGTQETDAVIVCFVIVVESSSSVEDINMSSYNDFKVRQGEWIITMVVDSLLGRGWSQQIEYILRKYGILKGVFCLELKEDEELKNMHALRAIVDKLYH